MSRETMSSDSTPHLIVADSDGVPSQIFEARPDLDDVLTIAPHWEGHKQRPATLRPAANEDGRDPVTLLATLVASGEVEDRGHIGGREGLYPDLKLYGEEGTQDGQFDDLHVLSNFEAVFVIREFWPGPW